MKTGSYFLFSSSHLSATPEAKCQLSAIFVECGKRLRLCTDYGTIIITYYFIVMTKKESIELNVFGDRAFHKNFL